MTVEQHVYPVEGREHVTDGSPCWCDPDLYRACLECEGTDPTCWRCGGEGMYAVERIGFDGGYIVVHRDDS